MAASSARGTRPHRGTGRPRDPDVERRALQAARLIYGESGKSQVTFANVAARAAVGKAALYRRWASPIDLLMDALRTAAWPTGIPDLGDAQAELAGFARALMELFVSSDGAATMRLATEFHDETEPFRQWITATSQAMIDQAAWVLQRAARRGEHLPNRSPETVMQILTGTLLSHTVFRFQAGRPLHAAEADQYCWNLAGLALGRAESARPRGPLARRSEDSAAATGPSNRKAELVRIAQRVAASRGFAELTLAAVAKSAGVSTPALYTHFYSRDDLLKQVIEVTAREYVEDLAATDDPAGSVESRLRMRLRRWATMPTPRLRVLHGAVVHSPDSPGVRAAVRRARAAWDAFLHDVLERGQARGEVRPDVDFDAAAQLLTSCLFGVEVAADTGLADMSLRALSDRLVDMFLAYVCARDGVLNPH
ncbi:TetR/AcrR family transcriptional regulator C-terminal ligand-binding domain-containing protein [Mycolicibacterium sp. XJ2546]